MDKSFEQMSALLRAVWPSISYIDWSEHCQKNVSPYDVDGVPKYTGILMHRSGGGCIGASTISVGFLPRPEKSAITVAKKTKVLTDPLRGMLASIEGRKPEHNIWGGGVLCSEVTNPNTAYAITGLPEIVDHLLVSTMMLGCGLISPSAYSRVHEHKQCSLTAARKNVGISYERYLSLKDLIDNIVLEGVKNHNIV